MSNIPLKLPDLDSLTTEELKEVRRVARFIADYCDNRLWVEREPDHPSAWRAREFCERAKAVVEKVWAKFREE